MNVHMKVGMTGYLQTHTHTTHSGMSPGTACSMIRSGSKHVTHLDEDALSCCDVQLQCHSGNVWLSQVQ